MELFCSDRCFEGQAKGHTCRYKTVAYISKELPLLKKPYRSASGVLLSLQRTTRMTSSIQYKRRENIKQFGNVLSGFGAFCLWTRLVFLTVAHAARQVFCLRPKNETSQQKIKFVIFFKITSSDDSELSLPTITRQYLSSKLRFDLFSCACVVSPICSNRCLLDQKGIHTNLHLVVPPH